MYTVHQKHVNDTATVKADTQMFYGPVV